MMVKRTIVFIGVLAFICLLATDVCRSQVDKNGAHKGWSVLDPGGGGFVTSILVDPRDDQTVYASTNVSGLRVSHDGGASWEMLTLPRSEYEQYGRQAQQIQERVATHPKRPGLLIFSVKETKQFPARIYTYSEAKKRFQCVFNPSEMVGPFCPFVFDPYDETGDTVYTAAGDIHFVDGSDYSYRHVGKSAEKGFRKTSGTLVLGFRYDAGSDSWKSEELYRSAEQRHIYSIAVRKGPAASKKELFFTTDDGLYRAELDEKARRLVDFARWRPSPIIPDAQDFTGGKIVYDPRNRHFYLSALTIDSKTRTDKRLGGLFVSFDDGKSWTKANHKGSGLDPSSYYFDLGLHPEDPEVVYAAMRYDPKKKKHISYLYRSTDGGRTWQNVWDPKKGFEWGWVYFGKGRMEGRVKKPPVSVNYISVGKNRVYATAQVGQIFVSELDGKRWKQVTTRTTKDGGWAATGFPAIAVPWSIGLHPTNPEEVIIPYGDHAIFGTQRGKDGLFLLAQNREYRSIYGGTLKVNPNNPNIVYFATRGPHRGLEQGSVIRGDLSLSGPQRWRFIGGCFRRGDGCEDQHGLTRGPMTSLLIHHRDAKEDLYVTKYADRAEGTSSTAPGDAPGVYCLRDAEQNIGGGRWRWELLSRDILFPRCMTAINGFSGLIVGTGGTQKGRDGGGRVYVLDREEKGTWKQECILDGTKAKGKPIQCVYDLDFCPDNKMIYFATDVGAFKMDLTGKGLEAVWGGDGKEVTSLEINRTWPNVLYIGSEFHGVYRSDDYGKTWQDLTPFLETPSVHQLELNSPDDRIFVITNNCGIWVKSFRVEK